MRVVGRLVSLIVCHGFSCNEFIAFGYPNASSNLWVVELLDSGPLYRSRRYTCTRRWLPRNVAGHCENPIRMIV
jgi:hypothetical protein